MHGTDAVECETCGYAVPAGGVIQIPFDDDPGDVTAILDADPPLEPCPNCGNAVASISAVAFVDAESRVVVCLAVDDHGAALAEGLRRSDEGWSFSMQRRPEDMARAVRTHLESLASQGSALAADLHTSVRKESGPEIHEFVFAQSVPTPSRRMLSALGMLGGDGKTFAETVAPFIATRCSFHGLIERAAPIDALDTHVPPWLVGERGIARLVEFGIGMGAAASLGPAPGLPKATARLPLEAGMASVLAAAWASDRTGATFGPPGPALWATCVVDWLLQHPDAAASLGPEEFLRRTVDNVQVANVGVTKMLEDPTRTWLIDAIEQRGLFGGIDFVGHLKQIVGFRSTGGQAGGKPPLVDIETEIRSLAAEGLLEEGEALWRERAPFLDTAGALAAAGAVIEGWEQAGHVERAARFLQEFAATRPDAPAEPVPAEVHVGFHNTVGNVLRRLDRLEEALAEYRLAAERLDEVRDPVRWRFTVLANTALGLQQMQAYQAAIELLGPLAGADMPDARRAEVLALIAANLDELGENEAGLEVAKRALDLLGPPDAAVNDTRERVLDALLTTSAHAGDGELALSVARELAHAANRRGDPASEARALITAARAARQSGDVTWRTLAADAAARLTDARARETTEGRNEAHDAIEASVLEVVGDVDGLERLVRATDSNSLEALTAMIELRAVRGEIERAGSELRAAWTIVLDQVFAAGVLGVSDVERLRSIRSLRGWTAEHALQAFDRHGGNRLVLLTAAELQSSLLGGYLTWPAHARGSPVRILDSSWLLDEAQGAAVVFAVQGQRNLRVALARDGREEVLLEWDGFELDRVRNEVEAVTRRALPGGDPLAKSTRWNAFAEALGAALSERVEIGDHVLFSLGYVLDGLPLHVVPTPNGPLGRNISCSYIASLYQLAGVRAHARSAARRPARAGVVSVWRTRDLDRTRAAFESGGVDFAGLLRDHGVDVETLTGREGSVAAVADLLRRVDILFVACHGIGGSDGRHAFLLAGEGQLPPMLIRQPRLPGAPDFLLDWEELSEPTASLVISAACASSSGSMSSGGERVSLDRALLASGTRTFVGPLWDVAVEDATAFSVDVTRRVLGGETWAVAWRQAVDDCAQNAAPASWQSFILVGDWR